MTQLKVDTITDAAGTAAPDLEDGLTVNGSALSTVNTAEYYSSGTEPSSPKNGAIWWDTANDKVNIYVNDAWYEVELGASASTGISWGGDTVIAFSNATNVSTYSITTQGNASDWGYDIVNHSVTACTTSVSDTTYGVFSGGWSGSAKNNISYFTFATAGNSQDFGDLRSASYQDAGASDGTYGLIVRTQGNRYADYITIATTGNASSFSDAATVFWGASGVGDGTYAVFVSGAGDDSMKYFTVQTPSSATTFGDATTGGNFRGGTGCSDSTYGVFLQANNTGGTADNGMDYITIATTGNATEFGELAVRKMAAGGTSDGTYGTFNGGQLSYAGTGTNTIEYITITTPSNATDFGDLIAATGSGAHCVAMSGAAS